MCQWPPEKPYCICLWLYVLVWCVQMFLGFYEDMGIWAIVVQIVCEKIQGKWRLFHYNNYGGYYRFSGGHRWIIIIYLIALWKLYGKYLDND